MRRQMLTVIITRPARDYGSREWTGVEAELDSLVRRMGFDIILTAAGARGHLAAYQVTGTKAESLGDAGHKAVRTELADLAFVYQLPTPLVGFGSIDNLL